MLSHLSSLLSTSAYIGIGSVCKLYQRLLCLFQPEQASNTKRTELHIDVLHHILAKIPLYQRLQTARQVNRQWAEAVAQQCSTQRALALQIGPSNEWTDFLKKQIFLSDAVVDVVNGSPKLNVDQLTGEMTSFLISTFPRLQTLSVLVDEPLSSEETQDQNSSSFAHLPVLISAMADNLTTLFLVFKTENTQAFLTHFPQLVTSINSLSKLQYLSLIDNYSTELIVPSFDLPLLQSLKTLEFYVQCFSADLLHRWEPHLKARKGHRDLMRITMKVFCNSPPFLSPDAAAHFYSLYYCVHSLDELRHFSYSFSNLTYLLLVAFNMPSLSSTLSPLTSLRQLKHLILEYLPHHHRRVIEGAEGGGGGEDDDDDDDAGNAAAPAMPPLPSLPSVQVFCLWFQSSTFKHSDLAGFHPSVFPNAYIVSVTFFLDDVINRPGLIDKATGCADCGWRLEYELAEPEPVIDQLRQCEPQMRQCLAHFAAPFATTKPLFKAAIHTDYSSRFLCRFDSEDDWPSTKGNDSDEDGDELRGQQFQVPEKCFQLIIK